MKRLAVAIAAGAMACGAAIVHLNQAHGQPQPAAPPTVDPEPFNPAETPAVAPRDLQPPISPTTVPVPTQPDVSLPPVSSRPRSLQPVPARSADPRAVPPTPATSRPWTIPPSTTSFRVFKLTHANAEYVAGILIRLFEGSQLKVVADERGSQVLVRGNIPMDFLSAVKTLDIPPRKNATKTTRFRVHGGVLE